jgi:hypothetical protein
VPPQVMAPCRALPKTPPGSSVPPRSLICQPRLLPTPSESTLPQLLIPLHFNSRISNTYKKGEGAPASNAQSLSTRHLLQFRFSSFQFRLREENPPPPSPLPRALSRPALSPLSATLTENEGASAWWHRLQSVRFNGNKLGSAGGASAIASNSGKRSRSGSGTFTLEPFNMLISWSALTTPFP